MMTITFRKLGIVGLLLFVLLDLLPGFSSRAFQQNNSPEVSITSPKYNEQFEWNTTIPYAVHVKDAEDGDSRYNEIPSREVLMWVAYLDDSASTGAVVSDLVDKSRTFGQIARSTCFSCHASRAKVIGPSFEMISKRYEHVAGAPDTLAKRIFRGSSGNWSDLQMPPHPEFSIEQLKVMVRWILQNSTTPNRQYFVGTSGAFNTGEKPGVETGKEVFLILSAYYDQGIKGQESSSRQGHDVAVLRRQQP